MQLWIWCDWTSSNKSEGRCIIFHLDSFSKIGQFLASGLVWQALESQFSTLPPPLRLLTKIKLFCPFKNSFQVHLPNLVKSLQNMSNLVKSSWNLSNLVESCQIFSKHVNACQNLSNLVKSCQNLSKLFKAC